MSEVTEESALDLAMKDHDKDADKNKAKPSSPVKRARPGPASPAPNALRAKFKTLFTTSKKEGPSFSFSFGACCYICNVAF